MIDNFETVPRYSALLAKDPNQIYLFVDTVDPDGKLIQNHWYYFKDKKWQDGGLFQGFSFGDQLSGARTIPSGQVVGEALNTLSTNLDKKLEADEWHFDPKASTVHLTKNGTDVLDPLYIPASGAMPHGDEELIFATITWENENLTITGGQGGGNPQTDDYAILLVDDKKLIIRTNI